MKHSSMSPLVRQTVEDRLSPELQIKRKLDALNRLASLELPIDDWDVIEAETAESRYR